MLYEVITEFNRRVQELREQTQPGAGSAETEEDDEEEMREEFPLHYKKIMDDPELQKVYLVPEHEEKDASLRA